MVNYRDHTIHGWLVSHGHDVDHLPAVWAHIDVPAEPYGLPRALRTYATALQAILPSVEHDHEDWLLELADWAERASRWLELCELPGIHQYPTAIRGAYTNHPLYALLYHGLPGYQKDEYAWLVGIMVLLQPHLNAGRTLERYRAYCRAVRVVLETVMTEGHAYQDVILTQVSPALYAAENADECLTRMAHSAHDQRLQEYLHRIRDAWRVLTEHRTPKLGDGRRGGRRGYQIVRGVPPGMHDQVVYETPRHLGRDWTAVESRDSARSTSPGGRAGEARGDAGTVGQAYVPPRQHDYSVPYYNRSAYHLVNRQVHVRRRNHAQDTLLATTEWTPHQVTAIVLGLQSLHMRSDDCGIRLGSSLVWVGLLSGIDRHTILNTVVRDRLPEDGPGATCTLTRDGWLAWRPSAGGSSLRAPRGDMAGKVHDTVQWVAVPRPGMLDTVVEDIAHLEAMEEAERAQLYDHALREVTRQSGVKVTSAAIQRHWWGQLARASGQPAAASMMTGHIRPSTGVPGHYLHVSARHQIGIYRLGYQAFVTALDREYAHRGESLPTTWRRLATPEARPTNAGYGSPVVPSRQSLTDEMQRVISEVDDRHGPDLAAANRMALALYHAITLICGLRSVQLRTAHAALLMRGYSTISDKDTRRFAKARHVPIPEKLLQVLESMWEQRFVHLARGRVHASARLLDYPPVPRDRDDLLAELTNPVAALSLITSPTRRSPELLTPHQLRVVHRMELDLPGGWQRHWLRTRMLGAWVSDQAANARMGHACIGQDAFDATSCTRVATTVESAAAEPEREVLALIHDLRRRM